MIKTILLFVVSMMVPFTALAKEHTFAAGDKIHISVANEPDYAADAVVRTDGKIYVSYAGDIMAAGLTKSSLQEAITNKIKEYIRNPSVDVVAIDMASNKAFITGGGVKPVAVDTVQHPTLLNLLTSREDISAVDLNNASLVRDGKEIKKNFSELVATADISQDVPLIGGDTIILPPTASKRGVYVVGAVNTPKLVLFRDGLTLLEAILEAGGFSKFASPNKTRVVRPLGDGKEQVIKVKAKRLIEDGDLTQNIVLLGGDLVIVEESFF